MALTYPLSLPTSIGIQNIQFTAITATTLTQSPFTFAQQVQSWPGEMWQADVTIPPCGNDVAEQWVAFLISLRGRYGTFYLNDPLNIEPRGSATTLTITGSQNSSSVTATINGTLNAGDWFNTPNYGLHKVTQNITSSGTMEIFPALREDLTAASCTLANAKGIFRLSTNESFWNINELNSYGITFGAMEAL